MNSLRKSFYRSVARAATIAFFFGACLTVAGCGPSPQQPGDQIAPAPAPPAPMSEATAIQGVVRLDGPQPKRVVLKTQGDPKCATMHANIPLLSDREVVNEDGGVRYAFVYLEDPPEHDKPVPETPVVLDQLGCVYKPHVLGVQVGQPLDITNSDDTTHNIRSFSKKNRAFNNAQPAGAKKRTKLFEHSEMPIKLKCDFHPWMQAYIFVVDHPFFGVTDEAGAFTISGVPPGDYTLVAVHEKYGEQKTTVTVTGGTAANVDFTYVPGN